MKFFLIGRITDISSASVSISIPSVQRSVRAERVISVTDGGAR